MDPLGRSPMDEEAEQYAMLLEDGGYRRAGAASSSSSGAASPGPHLPTGGMPGKPKPEFMRRRQVPVGTYDPDGDVDGRLDRSKLVATNRVLDDGAEVDYDSDHPYYISNTNRDILIRITDRLHPFGKLFKLEIIEIVMYFAWIAVSMVAMTFWAEINTYVFLIAGTVTNGLILIVHLPVLVFYWQTNRDLSHTHIFDVSMPIATGIPFMVVGWFAIGRWIDTYATCCDLADSQPNTADSEQTNRFIVAYALLIVTCLITLSVYPKAILAHLYPQVIVDSPKVIVHESKVIKSSEPDELDVDDDI